MIRSFAAAYCTPVFFGLFTFVIGLSLIAPRAASFAAPVAGLIMLVTWWAGRGTCLKPAKGELFFALAVPALAALSALWAIDPPFAVERGAKLAPMLIFGVVFIAAARAMTAQDIKPRFVAMLVAMYAAICAGIALEIFWDVKIYRFVNAIPQETPVSIVMMNRSMVVAAAFFLPVMLMLYRADLSPNIKWVLGGASTVALLAGLVPTESQSAQMLLILAVIVAALFPVRVRAAWVVMAALICALAIAAPWFAHYLFSIVPQQSQEEISGIMRAASIPHRLEVWNFVATEALKSPLYGQGIEAVRYIKSEQWLVLPNANNMLHPHNAALQLWVEFGIVGILLGCALFLYILKRLWMAPPLEQRVGLGVLTGMLAVMNTGYGLWQSWQIGLLLALFALTNLSFRTGGLHKS